MRSISRDEIHPVKMSTNPPKEVVHAGMRVIADGCIYVYVGIGWVRCNKATQKDYKEIPELI